MSYTKKNPSPSNQYTDTTLFQAFDDGIFDGFSFENIQAAGVAPANSAATNRTNLLAALGSSTKTYYVPAGDYQISNSAGYLQPTAPNVALVFAPGARFLFTDNAKGGLRFNTASRVMLYGLNLAYSTPAPTMVADQHALLLELIDELLIDDCKIDGPPSMGISINLCTRPSLKKLRITRTRADGLNISNSLDVSVDDVNIETTGDDGIAVTNYSIYTDQSGANITNVRLKDIGGRGIECLGSSGVTVDGFHIDNTLGAGISATYEPTYNGTGSGARVIDNIRFTNGYVKNSGAFSGYGHAPITEKSGILVYTDHTTKGTNFYIDNVVVEDCGTHGANVTPGIGNGTLANVNVRRASSLGIFAYGKNLELSDCQVEECNDTGFLLTNAQRLVMRDLVSINNAKTSGSFLAFSIINATTSLYTDMRVMASGLKVIDTQAAATSPMLYAGPESGRTLSGNLGRPQWLITGTNSVVNISVNVALLYGDVIASQQDVNANGFTIAVGTSDASILPLTAGAARTAAIMAAGVYDGQRVTLLNRSANSISFNTTPATSRIADAAPVLAASRGLELRWDASYGGAGTGRWVRISA